MDLRALHVTEQVQAKSIKESGSVMSSSGWSSSTSTVYSLHTVCIRGADLNSRYWCVYYTEGYRVPTPLSNHLVIYQVILLQEPISPLTSLFIRTDDCTHAANN
jgi:hypothetical protein